MGSVCKWWYAYVFDNKIRTLFHKPEKIIGPYLQEGMTAVDIGCGMGYFSIGMARLIGDKGNVISIDLQQEMLDVLHKRAVKAGADDRISLHRCVSGRIGVNVEADFVLAFWMVHEAPNAENLLSEIHSILKPNGKLLIAEPKLHVTKSSFEKTLQCAIQSGFEIVANPKVSFSRASLLMKAKQ
jgi:ubiquinone/menaquinone biosynthesis C-methylase UbiE